MLRLRPMVLISDIKKTNIRQFQGNEQRPPEPIQLSPKHVKAPCGPVLFPEYSCEALTTQCPNPNILENVGVLHNNPEKHCDNTNMLRTLTTPALSRQGQIRNQQTRPQLIRLQQTRQRQVGLGQIRLQPTEQSRPERIRPQQSRPELSRPEPIRPVLIRPEPIKPETIRQRPELIGHERVGPEKNLRFMTANEYLHQNRMQYPTGALPYQQPKTMGTRPIRYEKTTKQGIVHYGKEVNKPLKRDLTDNEDSEPEIQTLPPHKKLTNLRISSSTNPPYPGGTSPESIEISGETLLCQGQAKCYKRVWKTKKTRKPPSTPAHPKWFH
ncbi:unnamed protein product [Chrysodeixis includens]|uniref:Uncharacterized protein n=1 Tax=Chrysodeixis includens TaxID=689277 RepID=A0A9N8KZM3_CHRIL|nr:unnamed protein product [Chrysodeixis includens]